MKKKYFPQTFFQSLALLLVAMMPSIPILYLKSLKIISNDLFLVLNYEVWMLSVLLLFFLINKKRKVNLSNHFKFNIDKIIIVFIVLIILFQISLFLPLTVYFISEKAILSLDIKYYLLLTVSAAVFEELIFRGIFLDGYLIRYKAKNAILLSALFFGLIHFNLMMPTQFIGAIILGFITSYVYYYSRSVGMVILLHLSYNMTVYTMTYIHSTYGNNQINKVSDIYGNYSIYIIALSLFSMICLIYYIIKNKNTLISSLKNLNASRRLHI